MGNFLDFEHMIAPKIIEGFFALVTVGCVLLGIFMALRGNAGGLLVGVIVAVGGPLITRIFCEFLIVVFRIYEVLTDVNDQIDAVIDALQEEDSQVTV